MYIFVFCLCWGTYPRLSDRAIDLRPLRQLPLPPMKGSSSAPQLVKAMGQFDRDGSKPIQWMSMSGALMIRPLHLLSATGTL